MKRLFLNRIRSMNSPETTTATSLIKSEKTNIRFYACTDTVEVQLKKKCLQMKTNEILWTRG